VKSPFGLQGRGVLITGAASGIGRAVAEIVAAEGARPVLADIDLDTVALLAESLDGDCLAVALDVSSEEGWRAVARQISSELGSVNVLVNCAGVTRQAPILEIAMQDYLDQIQINQTGTFLGMRTIAPLIHASGGGAIVNLSSINALRGYRDSVGYAASKSAVLSMTKTAAHEFAALGIRVNAVAPGIIDTPMQRHNSPELQRLIDHAVRLPGRMGTAQEVARVIVFLASELSSYVTGAEVLVDGGVSLGGAS
jgi:3alpha(or 20beta)-hydroxysteroid dehydrogenase